MCLYSYQFTTPDLPNQFIEAHSNQRTDIWGGSPENRARFSLEIIKTFIEVWGDSKRVGIKLSPSGGFNDMGDPLDVAVAEYSYLVCATLYFIFAVINIFHDLVCNR